MRCTDAQIYSTMDNQLPIPDVKARGVWLVLRSFRTYRCSPYGYGAVWIKPLGHGRLG